MHTTAMLLLVLALSDSDASTERAFRVAGTLGVETLAYAPWAIMCYLSFVVALIYGFTGFAIAPRTREDETIPGS